jgi:hypothetical protein
MKRAWRWTIRAANLIWGFMANRLLLTLLALLTGSFSLGWAAQIAPAEARASQVASLQVTAAAQSASSKAPRAPVALARLPEPGLLNTRRHALAFIAPAPHEVIAPAVRTGIDRARE